jgi:cation transport ATPase
VISAAASAAPALRAADTGISVDSAADVAKASSDIILLEKDLQRQKRNKGAGDQQREHVAKV